MRSIKNVNVAAATVMTEVGFPWSRFTVHELEFYDQVSFLKGAPAIALKDGAAVGYVTSGAFGHCIGKSLAAGYVPATLAREGARFEIDILGEMRTATVHLEALYDPRGLKLRG